MIAHLDPRTTETERLDTPERWSKTQRICKPVEDDTTPDYLPRNARPMQIVIALVFVTLAIGIYTRALLFSAGWAAGWAARELAGSMWDQRGWAALVVFSIVGSVYMVNYSNRKGA